MNPWLTFALGLAIGVTAGITIGAFRSAPRGHEDHNGFHLYSTAPKKPAALRRRFKPKVSL